MKVCVTLWGIAAFLLAATSVLPWPAHRVEHVTVDNSLDMPLSLVVFVPEPPLAGLRPAAVLCQPMNNPPEFSRPLALELARNGFVVVTFNWSGQAPEQNRQLLRSNLHAALRSDVLAAIAYLKTRRDVDAGRIAIAGHSVGGNLAVDAGIDDTAVAAVACIGMAREVDGPAPANLLWTAGLYDEFWPPGSLASAYRANVGSDPQELAHAQTSFAGTRRALAISPTADHFTELLDWRIQRAVTDWFLDVAGLEKKPGACRVALRCLALTGAWVSAFAAGLITIRWLVIRHPVLLRGIPAAALFGVALLHHSGNRAAYEVVLYLTAIAALAGYISRCAPEILHKRLRMALRLGLVFWGSVVLTLCLNAAPAYFREPRFLLFVPEFVVQHVLDWLYAYLLLHSRQLLLANSLPGELAVRSWVYCLLAVELVAPGWLLRSASRLLGYRRTKGSADLRRVRPAHVAVLGLLVLLLAVLVWLRLGQGFITSESLLAAGRFMLRFGIVPAGAFAVLWRASARLWPRQAP